MAPSSISEAEAWSTTLCFDNWVCLFKICGERLLSLLQACLKKKKDSFQLRVGCVFNLFTWNLILLLAIVFIGVIALNLRPHPPHFCVFSSPLLFAAISQVLSSLAYFSNLGVFCGYSEKRVRKASLWYFTSWNSFCYPLSGLASPTAAQLQADWLKQKWRNSADKGLSAHHFCELIRNGCQINKLLKSFSLT